jgi:short-subunit dehydrogenase involved in D-alanine esterification of teichoic acids
MQIGVCKTDADMRLAGKTASITSGNSGIGLCNGEAVCEREQRSLLGGEHEQ